MPRWDLNRPDAHIEPHEEELMPTSTGDPTDRGRAHDAMADRAPGALTAEIRTRTASVLRRIDQELEQVRRATSRRIVWDSLLAGWEDPDDLLEADLWVEMGDEYCPEGEIVLTLIDEIRLGMCPPE